MSREERIKVLEIMLRIRKEQKDIVECAGGFCKNCNEDIQALQETIQDLKKLDEIEKKNKEIINYLKDEINTMGSGSSMFIVKTALQVVLDEIGGTKR